jgi:large subunit ribosomal protein L35
LRKLCSYGLWFFQKPFSFAWLAEIYRRYSRESFLYFNSALKTDSFSVIMPKMKTKSGAKKRFSFTATGKIEHKKAYHRHLLTKKDAKRKRRLRGEAVVNAVDRAAVLALFPYRPR